MLVFYPRPIHSGKKDREWGKEKGREKGIWDCCMLLIDVHSPPPPPLHHLSPILRATSPACGYGYQNWRHREEPPPYSHTPFDQFEAAAVVL
jgi:hypothetical protein